ncbi:hypothetical protein Fmac_013741 [Flemingia macrophylla]|uniref:Uncharacterized protein n=1 Tax=Flemingia macrophylla TaxID=520843 RepID=A0ABD1MU04_9FABA
MSDDSGSRNDSKESSEWGAGRELYCSRKGKEERAPSEIPTIMLYFQVNSPSITSCVGDSKHHMNMSSTRSWEHDEKSWSGCCGFIGFKRNQVIDFSHSHSHSQSEIGEEDSEELFEINLNKDPLALDTIREDCESTVFSLDIHNGKDVVYVAVSNDGDSSLEALSWALKHAVTPSSTVKVDMMLIEGDNVAKVIMDLVGNLNIRKLVIGITKFNLRKSECRRQNAIAAKVLKNAQGSCDIKIICEGKEVIDQMIDCTSSRSIDDRSLRVLPEKDESRGFVPLKHFMSSSLWLFRSMMDRPSTREDE